MRKVTVVLLALVLVVAMVGTISAQGPNVKVSGRPVNLTVGGAALPEADVSMVLDDGTVEDAIGLNDGVNGYQFEWLNRFTPAAGEFPFNLEEIWTTFCYTSVPVGGAIELLVYTDTDGDANPTNAVLVGDYSGTVLTNDCTWNVYTLPEALRLDGPGDVLIGLVNRYVVSGVTPADFPASIDTTSTQQRSWIAWWNLDPPVPPVMPPDYALALIDDFGFPGNWAIRGYGTTIDELTLHVATVALTKQGTGPWLLTGKGQIHDGFHALAPGVLVQARWTLPSGTKVFRTFTTGAQGGYQFGLNVPAGSAGQFTFCVVGLVKVGYTYVPGDNHMAPNPPCKRVTIP